MKRMLRGLVLVAALATVVSACGEGSSETITYHDADDRSLFELPNDWHLYPADELVQVAPVPFLPDTGGHMVSFVAFDGAAARNLGNVALDAAASEYPLGAQIIRQISDTQRNDISNRSMALSAYNVDSAGLGVEMLNLVDDPEFDRNYDGIRGYLGVTLEDGTLEGVIYVRAVHNPEMTELYSMAAGCSVDCFTRERQTIEEAVNSWIVNTRR